MNIRETARYAALGAAAALLVSGGIYAGSSFQARQLNARASDGYSGNFDYVQKQQQGGASGGAAPTADGNGTEPASTAGSAAQNAPVDPPQEPEAASGTEPSAPAADPTPAPPADPIDDQPGPAEDTGPAAGADPTPAAEPGSEPASEAPAPGPIPEPGEPGGGGSTAGPAIFQAVNPCLLVKCDPPPPPGKLTLDPCLADTCVTVEDEPVFVPTIDYSKLPSLQLDLRK